MKTIMRNARASTRSVCALFGLLFAGFFSHADPSRDQWHPSASEIFKLPKYCQGQFNAELSKIPGYTFNCNSPYMNHYCPGLVLINRVADISRPKVERRENLRMARGEIGYTLQHMPKSCSVEADVKLAAERIRILEITLR